MIPTTGRTHLDMGMRLGLAASKLRCPPVGMGMMKGATVEA